MRLDFGSNMYWIEIEQPRIVTDSQPPSLVVPLKFTHVFTDRFTEFYVNLRLLCLTRIKIGTEALFVTLSPGMKTETRSAEFFLYRELMQLIEDERGKSRAEDIPCKLHVEGKCIARSATGYGVEEKAANYSIDFKITLSEWKRALGLTNYQITLLPSDLVDKLEELRRKWGFWRIDDVIAKFLEIYEGGRIEVSQQFLVTLYDTKTIRDKLAEFSEKSTLLREVRVASPYLDNTGAEYLIKMLKNGVKVKIITRRPDKKAHEDAISVLKQLGAEIKYDKMLHARLIIFDDIAVLVSSADLDAEGLNNQKQAGILSFDKVVVRDAITFFDKVWEYAETEKG